MGKITLNRMPAPTWNRLDMNYKVTDELACKGALKCETDAVPEGIECTAADGQLDMIGGVGEIPFSDDPRRTVITGGSDKPLILRYELDGEGSEGRTELIPAPGRELTVIMYIGSESGKQDRAALQTLIKADSGSKVKLIQVFDTEDEVQIINDIGAECSDEAEFSLTQIFIGGKNTITGILAGLNGYKSSFTANIGYLLGGTDLLDMNLIARHKGKKSRSRIDVKGVLSDSSRKTFRGTIDFIKGSAGAVGAENEDVLLMDEKVENKTVPVILCEEEDVEGSHGASIGRLRDDVIYYMTSRGLPAEEVYKLMAAARLESIVRSIPDENAKERALQAIAKRSDNNAR